MTVTVPEPFNMPTLRAKLTAETIAGLVNSDFSPYFLLGLLTATVRGVLLTHPDDLCLQVAAAALDAYDAHGAAEQVSTDVCGTAAANR